MDNDKYIPTSVSNDNVNLEEVELIGSRISEGVCQIIEGSRHTIAVYLNSEVSMTYWNIGRYMASELDAIGDEKYGSKIVSTVSRLLTERYGKGYQRANLFIQSYTGIVNKMVWRK